VINAQSKKVRVRTIWLAAALGLGVLAVPGCKSQDPAIFLSISGAYRIPLDADSLRLDVYDVSSAKLLVTQTFPLAAGVHFPFTVTVDDTSGNASSVMLIATATLSTPSQHAVGTGKTTVSLEGGATVNAAIALVDE
jgi:hypothetical protein